MATFSQPVKSVKGTCRWVRPLGQDKKGVLLINGVSYKVIGYRANFRLVKEDGTIYDLEATAHGFTCDCPDATFRQRECKHAKALKAALAAAK